jgi:hypothetical protein
MLLGLVVVRASIQAEAGVGGFMIRLMTHCTIRFHVNVNVQVGKMAISFHFHSELNILMDTIQMVKKAFQLLWSLGADDEGPLKCHWTSTKLHSVTTQKITLFTVAAVRTSTLTHFIRILLRIQNLSGVA